MKIESLLDSDCIVESSCWWGRFETCVEVELAAELVGEGLRLFVADAPATDGASLSMVAGS